MTSQLADRVAIVTGAGRGIGAAIATSLHAAGAKVVIADVIDDREEMASSLGEGASAVHADVSDADSVRAMVEHAVSTFGRLDVLVNNAGIDGQPSTLADCTPENFSRVVGVNLGGAFLGMKYAFPEIAKNGGGGAIVNVASIAAVIGVPGLAPYSASKGGITALTRTAAAEFADAGVRVNAILPGLVHTALAAQKEKDDPDVIHGASSRAPLGRGAEPAEIAELVVFLASDASSFITGAAIPIDGGYTAN